MRPNQIFHTLAVLLGMAISSTAYAQATSNPADSAIIFASPRPLLENSESFNGDYNNTWGLSAIFSDFGFGVGLFYGHKFSDDITALISADFSNAKGRKEFPIQSDPKINRIFLVPIMASVQYRLFRSYLSDNFRPYLMAGAGTGLVITTPADQEFFSAFKDNFTKAVPGGFLGVGANFGSSKSSTFGANLKYYIIPYKGGIQSTRTQRLDNLNALFLSVSYGFNF